MKNYKQIAKNHVLHSIDMRIAHCRLIDCPLRGVARPLSLEDRHEVIKALERYRELIAYCMDKDTHKENKALRH